MEDRTSRNSLLPAILAILLIAAVAFVAYVWLTFSVVGTATLPNGVVVTISGPCGISERRDRTTINACGRQFVFTATGVSVDGAPVATIDGAVKQVAIDTNGNDAELLFDGTSIPLPVK